MNAEGISVAGGSLAELGQAGHGTIFKLFASIQIGPS